MYKVVIAEDEPYIRMSLIEQMDWANMECRVVGEADNGNEAIWVINTMRPDLIITDIKMSGLDGIQLSRYVSECLKDSKVILITGFAQVDYAQAAIKLGVSDFILKPINPDELEQAVRKATEELRRKRQLTEDMEHLKKMVQESLPVLRERFFQELSNHLIVHSEEILARAENIGVSLNGFSGLAIEIDEDERGSPQGEWERQTYMMGIKQFLQAYKGGGILYAFESGRNVLAITDTVEEVQSVELANSIQTGLSERFGISVSIGVSKSYDHILKLGQCINDARFVLKHKFYSGSGSVIFSGMLEENRDEVSVNFTHRYLYITDCVKIGDMESAELGFEGLWKEMTAACDENSIRSKSMELVVILFNALKDINLNLDGLMPLAEVFTRLSHSATTDALRTFLKNILFLAAGERNREIKGKNTGIVRKVLDYLEQNYNRNISLEELAEQVYLNPKYLCRLVKKETGENITDIVSKLRIEKAKEMMADVRLKTYEISNSVGISDSRYFSQLFKKITGVTPSEYRSTLK